MNPTVPYQDQASGSTDLGLAAAAEEFDREGRGVGVKGASRD